MGLIVNDLDTILFSIQKASQLVKEIRRRVETDKFIMFFLFLVVCEVVALIVVKVVNPGNRDIRDIRGLVPPAPARRLLFLPAKFRGREKEVAMEESLKMKAKLVPIGQDMHDIQEQLVTFCIPWRILHQGCTSRSTVDKIRHLFETFFTEKGSRPYIREDNWIKRVLIPEIF
ncbi:hypothetical protein MKW94_019332 [Papaver nudicaule]|uniref:Uncharacterized protein n=1 Tax=Papaver nudicaule TaxID=74823 RepID=A0AA41VTZ8_PAPNU|nr:hypothetical protein [Papaver nudicaule]